MDNESVQGYCKRPEYSAMALTGLVAVVGLWAGSALATPSLVAVTPFEGPSTIVGVALSADGSTVVGWRPRQNRETLVTDNRAFAWTREDGHRPISQLEAGAPNGEKFQPYDVSGDGSRIVGALEGRPIVWERGGSTTSLELLPDGSGGGTARGISDDGRFVVGTAHDGQYFEDVVQTPGGGMEVIRKPLRVPVRWSLEDGSVIALSTLPGIALDVSNNGIVVGEVDAGIPNSTVGIRWDSERGQQFVPSADPESPAPFGGAAAIAADGSVIAGDLAGPRRPDSPTLGFRAFAWRGDPGDDIALPRDGLELIDPVTDFILQAEATGVSADGSTIVGAYRVNEGRLVTRPFIWTQQGGFQDLRVLLNALGLSNTEWDLFGAIDVSADGKTIIGNGRRVLSSAASSDFIWIAVIPEPSTALLLAIGLSILAGAGRGTRSDLAFDQANDANA